MLLFVHSYLEIEFCMGDPCGVSAGDPGGVKSSGSSKLGMYNLAMSMN